MEFWIGLFLVIVVLGALAGGKSFGETISKGIGCLIVIVIGIIALLILASESTV